MYWSRYNIELKSPYGRFIYNTYTNNLMEIDTSLASRINKIKEGYFSCLLDEKISIRKRSYVRCCL